MYSFVHIFSIKASTEVLEELSLHIIERRFRLCYQYKAINKVLVSLIALNISQQNPSQLMSSFFNHRHIYYLVHISSIETDIGLVEDLL